MKKLKRLINKDGEVTSVFKGKSGKVYRINNQLNITRYSAFQKLSLQFGYGVSFQNFYNRIDGVIQMVNDIGAGKGRYIDLALELDSLQKSALDSSTSDFDMGFYLASLYIVSDSEDLTTWDTDSATEKIKDWVEYDSQDFFTLNEHFVADLKKKNPQ